MTVRRVHPYAAVLLQQLIEAQLFTVDALAEQLVATAEQVRGWATGRSMSLPRQLCLARLVIKQVPALRRDGRRLEAQTLATVQYRAGLTITHSKPYVMHWG
jgi:hypothetical protein